MGDTRRLACPTCRSEFHAPTDANLLTNFALIDVLEARETAPAPPPPRELCGSCDSATAASSFCLSCNVGLCAACTTAHQTVLALRKHVVQDIAAPRRASCEALEIPQLCEVHQEVLRYLCSCEELVCRDCGVSRAHANHTIVLIKEIADERKTTLLGITGGESLSLGCTSCYDSNCLCCTVACFCCIVACRG
jgi:hypothetical protein